MRLLLYFLALLTGFSAAEAARSVETGAPATAASQVEQAEAFATAIVVSTLDLRVRNVRSTLILVDNGPAEESIDVPVATTPVSRAERAHK
ncbi:MAG: hypothetical protein WA793_00200 [Sphingorhabdus sp.]|uniref:hypothetical protein n=1 Tax=Sphingorhabdus sp. TaxID=1902408 RepID=UPI003CC48027